MVETVAWKQSRLYGMLKDVLHAVILLLGSGQHGKTVAVLSLLSEPPFKDRDVVLVNYDPEFVKRYYPQPRFRALKWPENLKELKDLVRPGKDILFFDDAAFLMAARDAGTRENKDIQKVLTVLSHMELIGIIAVQSMAICDASVVQSQDVYPIHKHMDPLALSFERSQIMPYQATAELMLRKYRKTYPEVHPKAWSWSSRTNEMLISNIPDYYVPEMSKPFKEAQPWR